MLALFDSKSPHRRRQLLILAIAILCLYIFLPSFGSFRSSWHLVRHPVSSWLLAAVAFMLITYFAAAGTYCWLAVRRLHFGRTVIVQFAAMFINRLLPAGIGALGTNYAYLRHEGHRPAQASGIVALNNVMGFIGHAVLLLSVLVGFSSAALLPLRYQQLIGSNSLKIGLLAVGIGLLAGVFWAPSRFRRFMREFSGHFRSYRHRLIALLGSLVTSMLVTICNTLCLACCMWALHAYLPLTFILMIFSFGVGAGAVTPTPGGLGGFEAGLAAGFIAYGIDAPTALAVALLYRLVTYWLPLTIGAPALLLCQRKGWLEIVSKRPAQH